MTHLNIYQQAGIIMLLTVFVTAIVFVLAAMGQGLLEAFQRARKNKRSIFADPSVWITIWFVLLFIAFSLIAI